MMYFHGNHKIISLTNPFKFLLSAEILSEWKTEFIYLVRNLVIYWEITVSSEKCPMHGTN